MRVRYAAQAIAAFLVGAAIVTFVLVLLLPVPPGRVSNVSSFGSLMLLTLAGPLLFAWASGPTPLGALGLLAAVAVPVVSTATLFLGFFRGKSYLALASAAATWNAFGGFFAFVAVTGSI